VRLPLSRIQLIGMSATLPNFRDLADWLQAAHYETDFRPVPLDYRLKARGGSSACRAQHASLSASTDASGCVSVNSPQVGNELQDFKGNVLRELPDALPADRDHCALLMQENIDDGGSGLVFCGTKSHCQSGAKQLAAQLRIEAPSGDAAEARAAAAAVVRRAHSGDSEPDLALYIEAGVAFHHSGLTGDEREAVEAAFRVGGIRVICCTSTLAAGVNLPARLVLIRHDYVGRPIDMLDYATYKQMAGRAGRAGLDAFGVSILLARESPTPTQLAHLRSLGTAAPGQLSSALNHNGLMRVMLEAITSGLVRSEDEMGRYMRCTLLCKVTPDFEEVKRVAFDALTSLQKAKMIKWDVDVRVRPA
jgi:DNA polymerase theta